MKRKAAILMIALSALLAKADTTATLDISVGISGDVPPAISVTPASMTWDASVHPDSYFRFNSGVFTCSFFAASSPWAIRVYHTNGSHYLKGPLKSTTAERYLSMRVWQPNFGVPQNYIYYGKPTNFYDLGYLPDPMLVWTTGVSRLVRDVTAATNLASSVDGDVSPVRFNFVVMDTNRIADTYSGKIFFEIVTP
jgi:hypothetical protein